MTRKSKIELTEGEREILHAGLEVLSPDSPDASEILEELTQKILDSTLEPGDVEMDFTEAELEMSIAALDIVDPDEFEMAELAETLADRMRDIHSEISHEVPGF